jgi:hypothetical protein
MSVEKLVRDYIDGRTGFDEFKKRYDEFSREERKKFLDKEESVALLHEAQKKVEIDRL